MSYKKPFAESEYEQRVNIVKQRMHSAGFDLLICQDPASIGLNYPPDWGERTASLRPGDTSVLQAGMCFHFQSGMWLDDFGAAISEPFVVAEKGGECLSHVARELIVIA